jgi:hypothetical protein
MPPPFARPLRCCDETLLVGKSPRGICRVSGSIRRSAAKKKPSESMADVAYLIYISRVEEEGSELVTALNVVPEVLFNSEASIDHILLRLVTGAQ